MNRSTGVRVRMPSAARPGGAPVRAPGPGAASAAPPLGLSWASAGPPQGLLALALACQEKPQCAIHNGHCGAEMKLSGESARYLMALDRAYSRSIQWGRLGPPQLAAIGK